LNDRIRTHDHRVLAAARNAIRQRH
jgi:hypothetical protein